VDTSPSGGAWFSYQDLTYLIFLLALPTYALAVADKRSLTVAEFVKFDGFRYFHVLIASILAGLIILVSALALLIPLIWTVAWYAFVAFGPVDKRLNAPNSLNESKRLGKNNKAKVWGIIGASILMSIPGFILMAIPGVSIVGELMLTFVTILSTGATAILYRWLQHNVPETEAATALQQTETK
jgi:hypothetical protein